MYNLTKKQKEVIHKALITASDNGTLDEFTNEELKLINRAETIVNKLTIPVVVVPKGTLCDHKWKKHNEDDIIKYCSKCYVNG
jgi:hypothetical protein